MDRKNLMIVGSLICAIIVIFSLGTFLYINSGANHPTNKFYSGEWRLDGPLFAVNQVSPEEFNDLYGSYDAYKENGTIILIGNGKQLDEILNHDIKVVIENHGNNTKVSYYMDGKINSYQIIKGFNADTVYNLNHRFGIDEQAGDENLMKELYNATTTTKLI